MTPRARKLKLPRLPSLLERKMYKTGQTRGADDDVIYQNRVSRNSTVLIPYALWDICSRPPVGELNFENGHIVIINPVTYFNTNNIDQELESRGLYLGENVLLFYETRNQWNTYNPELIGWSAAKSRQAPLGGHYVARVPAITSAKDSGKIIRGFNTTSFKGAGIRIYEYASSNTNSHCRLQLEALYWLCLYSDTVAIKNGMSVADATARKLYIQAACQKLNLLDIARLTEARIINRNGVTICPLCLKELSSQGFFNRLEQAQGREVPDLTITQLNLFHIEELRYGVYNHKPYNLGWGHHHCNVVVKDSGIMETLEWMHGVVQMNIDDGHFTPENNSS